MNLNLGNLHINLFYECDENEKETAEKYLTENHKDVSDRVKKFYETGNGKILDIAPCLWVVFYHDGKNRIRGHVMGRKVWESE